MPTPTTAKHPRDGTSQADRPLPALDPAWARIDDRTVQDFLAFAREYAAGLKFFDDSDREAGDWVDVPGPGRGRRRPGGRGGCSRPADRPPRPGPRWLAPALPPLFLAFLHLLGQARRPGSTA